MSKPADIPQDVWDRAVFVFSTAPATQGHYETIARAILTAEQREREACTALAEGEITRVRQRMADTSDKPRMLVNQAWGMCGDTAAIIRDAIRKRGEP